MTHRAGWPPGDDDWPEEDARDDEQRDDGTFDIDPAQFGDDADCVDPEALGPPRWPLTWRGLYPRERWLWFQTLWNDVCGLSERYHLAVRSDWWEDDIQVEALAALAAWVHRYDTGEWDDPPGKLALLYDLDRVAAMLREGLEPFDPRRDRPAFVSHVIGLGADPP
ncbi:MAG TPA: hypothetical protein VFN55_14255 [Solirubrobacteraceae bacterium]|nr:hypothetical protein [Solirubrobacteraceae bacterium]